jgi:hypothetical protein
MGGVTSSDRVARMRTAGWRDFLAHTVCSSWQALYFHVCTPVLGKMPQKSSNQYQYQFLRHQKNTSFFQFQFFAARTECVPTKDSET